ncbi:MAG: CoA ester lyase [Chloroflexota bacterium]|nr:CoA ester lyase [Chloroflexota bacterium]
MLLRSLLFVPGNQLNMLEKALGLNPDAFIPDMEDSVPYSEKAVARQMISDFLPQLSKTGIPIIPRVNSLKTSFMEDDIRAVVGSHIQGISIGKIGTSQDIDRISQVLADMESDLGLDHGSIKILPWIETALGIVNVYSILNSSRIMGAGFGAEDFTNDMGIERKQDDIEIMYPRARVAIAARAAGVPALDTPFFKFRDSDGLERDSLLSKRLGFKGKFAIHPSQIEPINISFSPSREQLEEARRIIDVYEKAERSGRASTSLDGMVIDVPVVRRARALLDSVNLDRA